jgi:uncharacterized coiled-coil DUF342 family protein
MTFQKALAAGALLFALTIPGFAQDKATIPYVDMSTAQALVDTLVKENETLKADADKLRKEAVGLTDQITTTKKWVNDLTPILEEVKARNADLATVSEPVVDRVLKAKSISAAEKNKAGEKKIAKRIDEMNAKVVDLAKQIETRQFQAAVDDAKVGRNNDDIILLQATLSKTKVQEANLNDVITQIDTLSTKVDSFLQQSSAALNGTTATTK